ncbi:MAG: 4-hydroxy-tetrahydrodipicolinate synthase [Enterocloster sp.]
MKKEIFRGSAVALAAPMDRQGDIDYKAVDVMLSMQLEGGTDAILINGTTGESAALTDRERLELLDHALRYVDGRVPVIAGTGSNSTAHAIALSKEAKKAGADGLLLVTPYYNKATQKGLIAHFTAIADAADLPILLYNVPTRTGVDIKPQTYKELSLHPNIVGTKEAGGNISQIAHTAALCGDDLAIYSGNDDQTLAVLALGGKGVISVLANILPGEMSLLCRRFFVGDLEGSRRLQLSLLPLMQAMFWEVNPIPVKAALAMMGVCGENYRLPMTRMEEGKKEELKRVMERMRKT